MDGVGGVFFLTLHNILKDPDSVKKCKRYCDAAKSRSDNSVIIHNSTDP